MGNRSLEATSPLPSRAPPQWVDDAPDQSITHWYVHHAAGALDLVARVQMLAFSQEHDADFVLINVECDSVQVLGGPMTWKLHQFVKANTRQARDLGDTNGDTGNRSHLAQSQVRREGFAPLAQAGKRAVEDTLQRIGHWAHLALGATADSVPDVDLSSGLASGLGSGLASSSLSNSEMLVFIDAR